MEEKNCGRCALYNNEAKGCVRTQQHQESTDYCSSFITEVPICGICGQLFLPPVTYVIEDEKIITACGACSTGLSTCRTCTNAKYCDFQQNPIALPQMVQVTQRQGNMVVQQTITNPERIAATCKVNCPCWDSTDEVCNRHTVGTCGNSYNPSYLP